MWGTRVRKTKYKVKCLHHLFILAIITYIFEILSVYKPAYIHIKVFTASHIQIEMKVIIFFGLIGLISAQFGLGGWHPFHGTLPQKVQDFAKATLRKMNMETTNFMISDHDMQSQVI